MKLPLLRRMALPLLLCAGLFLSPTATGAAAGTSAEPLVTPQIVTSTASGGNTIALTFDDGPNPPDTTRLLQVLAQHNVTAVFCLQGNNVQRNPDVVRQIAAAGHVLCNHSMNHSYMGGWSADQIRADMQRTNQIIQQAVPGAQIRYFRAPYGDWGQTPQVAAQLGMQPLGWRFDIADWESASADQLYQRIMQRATPGAVALLHDGGGNRAPTVDAVNRAIPTLQAQGWRFDLPAAP